MVKTNQKGWKNQMADQNRAHANPVQVEKFLRGINYPCSKQNLLSTAKKEGADQNVMNLLQKLPDKKYGSPVDVSEAIGKLE
jgi:hypothetical protein